MSGGSLAAFRVVVGLVGVVSCIRLLVHDWLTAFWIAPRHHFHWPGLWWVRAPSAGWLRVLVVVIALCFGGSALAATLGRRVRPALLVATVGFAYLGALDVAPYLNHYWLLVLAGLLLCVLPDGGLVPQWSVRAARALVALTYVWAAIAKLDADWLRGRQLHGWLAAHDHWPVVGAWLDRAGTARALSWAGLLFDASVVPLLLIGRTRRLAYCAVVVFHVVTALLFPIGMFPWLMIGATLIFFPPGWPDRWWPGARGPTVVIAPPRIMAGVVTAALVVLAIIPARGYLSDVEWSEHGGRFSWRVMAVDKVGLAELHVRDSRSGEVTVVLPARDLSPLQAQQVTWQPDLLLQWAHIVAGIERTRVGGPVEVRADVWISVNGHAPARFVDPDVDLAKERWTWTRPRWVLRAPDR